MMHALYVDPPQGRVIKDVINISLNFYCLTTFLDYISLSSFKCCVEKILSNFFFLPPTKEE